MPEMTLTREDLRNLGSTLDQMAQSFDERERMLLLAIVALANEALVARSGDEVTGFGKVLLGDMQVTKTVDVASPGLFANSVGQLGGGDSPSESLSLNFSKINFEY